jgi:hypothetical protein
MNMLQRILRLTLGTPTRALDTFAVILVIAILLGSEQVSELSWAILVFWLMFAGAWIAIFGWPKKKPPKKGKKK